MYTHRLNHMSSGGEVRKGTRAAIPDRPQRPPPPATKRKTATQDKGYKEGNPEGGGMLLTWVVEI